MMNCTKACSLKLARIPVHPAPSPITSKLRLLAPRPRLMVWDVAIGTEKGEKRMPQEYDDVSDNVVFTELTRKDSGK